MFWEFPVHRVFIQKFPTKLNKIMNFDDRINQLNKASEWNTIIYFFCQKWLLRIFCHQTSFNLWWRATKKKPQSSPLTTGNRSKSPNHQNFNDNCLKHLKAQYSYTVGLPLTSTNLDLRVTSSIKSQLNPRQRDNCQQQICPKLIGSWQHLKFLLI